MKKVPMTKQGAENLRVELHRLKQEERPKVIEAIAEARSHGDLKENAEYHAAREQQGFIEARINEIESKLSNVQIIDILEMENNGKIIFGATVELVNLATEAQVTYKIVGEDEADIKESKISYSSPMGKSLIGKMEGDEIDVQTPSGVISYEIEKVKYI